ncbi:TetR/AcrR family transcriptional regulator [Rhodococcus maanshanensis]|uniref:DNA-binding transcriptional regulator, AcrR family n=1 Tax=Rhodococcus maanshanensis TaxID=183556 RepID=A0A1H7QWE2_9NOCA|nr:TetR/AcrR family transcriptional regulator [Rhodococcus maanshanensis]SEL52048.1 DNA-binding transcriptional regulator, AcrR family [Rhodococcus maanshanensis]
MRVDGTAGSATPKRVTKRRIQTRERLLDAALLVFADEGFGRSTVEQVCERAGYTRGAFYSNFASLDELFLAMWEQRSAQMLIDVREADVATRAKQQGPVTLEAMTAALLEAIPVDDRWYRITAEFTAHALRNPSLKRVMAARENAILATILPLVEAGLAGVGRRATDPQALGRALVAVHDGTTVQCLMEPESDTVRRARTNLFVSVLRNYSEEV